MGQLPLSEILMVEHLLLCVLLNLLPAFGNHSLLNISQIEQFNHIREVELVGPYLLWELLVDLLLFWQIVEHVLGDQHQVPHDPIRIQIQNLQLQVVLAQQVNEQKVFLSYLQIVLGLAGATE